MSLIKYTDAYSFLTYQSGYEPYSESARLVGEILEHLMPDASCDSKKIITCLLSLYETDHGFIENTYKYPVSISADVLSMITKIDKDRTMSVIQELKDAGFLEGDSPHFGILKAKRFYSHPSIGRQYIQKRVRIAILAIGKCVWCGRTDNLSIDHIIPVTLGGSNEEDNLQCLCLPCNISKGNRFIG